MDDTKIKETAKGSVTDDAEAVAGENGKTTEKEGARNHESGMIATAFAASAYKYAFFLKSKGHATILDMLFRDAMQVNIAANTASNSIGSTRFLKTLEEGFYAAGRISEYLKFVELIGASGEGHEALISNCDTLRRILAASVRTCLSKSLSVESISNFQF